LERIHQALDFFLFQLQHLIPFDLRSFDVRLKLSKNLAGIKFEQIAKEVWALREDRQSC
jgi:hypothetical protein